MSLKDSNPTLSQSKENRALANAKGAGRLWSEAPETEKQAQVPERRKVGGLQRLQLPPSCEPP